MPLRERQPAFDQRFLQLVEALERVVYCGQCVPGVTSFLRNDIGEDAWTYPYHRRAYDLAGELLEAGASFSRSLRA